MSTQVFENSFEVKSPASLLVKNIRGDISITPGADGIIKVKATQLLDSGDDEDTKIEIYQEENGRVCAAVKTPDSFFGSIRPCKVEFEIEAPVKCNIRVKAVSSSLEADGFEGELLFKTVSGDMKLGGLRGEVELESVSGDIRGGQISGKLHASSVSGDIELRECDLPSLKASTVSGDVALQTALAEGPYKLNSVSGSLTLAVPVDARCVVDASGVSGRFYTDLPLTHSRIGRRSWHVQTGSGGTDVSMKTVSGKMRLVSSFEVKGAAPGEVYMSTAQRTEVLTKLSEGEISVEDAIQQLS